MTTQTVHLTGWRNVPFQPDEIGFARHGVPIDLTGLSFALDVRAVAGTGAALISLDTAANDTANGVRVVDATGGVVRIQIAQADMAAAYDAALVAGLMKAGEDAPLLYDLLLFGADGYPTALIEGSFTIKPGTTLL